MSPISQANMRAGNYRKPPRRKRGKKSGLPRSFPMLAPNKMAVKLRLSDGFSLSGQVGGVPEYAIYRANDCYDTDLSNSGKNGQPMGFDQWCSGTDSTGLYKRFTVLSSVVRCTFINTSDTEIARVTLHIRNNSSGVASPGEYLETKGCKIKYLLPKGQDRAMATLSHKWTPRRAGRSTKQILGDDDFAGAYNSVPSVLDYYYFTVDGLGGTTDPVILRFTIDFNVVFWDINTPDVS